MISYEVPAWRSAIFSQMMTVFPLGSVNVLVGAGLPGMNVTPDGRTSLKLKLNPLVPVEFDAVKVTSVGVPYRVWPDIAFWSTTLGEPSATAGAVVAPPLRAARIVAVPRRAPNRRICKPLGGVAQVFSAYPPQG